MLPVNGCRLALGGSGTAIVTLPHAMGVNCMMRISQPGYFLARKYHTDKFSV